MALFDNLKNKALQTAQAAADKTKIMMETAKLNGMIEDEKKKINSTLMRIGEICYENYPENMTASLGEMVDQINDSKAKIVDYSKQVNRLKGVSKCEQCGAEVVQYDKAFCSNCGASMANSEAEAEGDSPKSNDVICGGCSSAVAPGLAFCPNCGHKMNS